MKVSVILTVFLVSVVCASPRDMALHNVGAVPAVSASAGFVNGEWVGNVQCTFHLENDCALSIQAAGRRIDSDTHKSNEDVLYSCLSSTPSVALVIHALTFADIQDYTCLQETNREYANVWLDVLPIITPVGTFTHGTEVSLTCTAPTGASLYWQLSGAAADHAAATIATDDDGASASSTITFTLADTDHFAQYTCCLNTQTGQPPNDYCSTYVVTDDDDLSTVSTTTDYSTLRFSLTVDINSKPVVDASTILWQKCVTLVDPCDPLLTFDVTDDPDNYHLSTNLQVVDDTNFNYYKFSASDAAGTAIPEIDFTVNRLTYVPLLTQLPSQIYYNQADETYTIVIQVTVGASPTPTITWTEQTTNGDSLGSVDITTGGIYSITTQASSDTESVTTLVISPYDPTLANAIYTVVAENDNGCSTLDVDVTVGPSYLTLTRISSTQNATYSFQCQFESFPEANYEINVVAAYDSKYTVSSTSYDGLYSLYTLIIDVTVDAQNTYFLFTCTAYNPHDAATFKSDSITVLT